MPAKSKELDGYHKWFNEMNLENVFAVAKRIEDQTVKKPAARAARARKARARLAKTRAKKRARRR